MSTESPAMRHRRVAGTFGAVVDGVSPDRWDAATPVADWRARDVVSHLADWSRGLLAAGADVRFAELPDLAEHPAEAWHAHASEIQALVDDPGDRILVNPHMGEVPIAEAIDRFYTTDVLMHTWDLARATDQNHGLDTDECAALLAGMEPIDQMLRDSGQYGPRVSVPDDADAVDALMAFIGRDPAWQPDDS